MNGGMGVIEGEEEGWVRMQTEMGEHWGDVVGSNCQLEWSVG